MGLKDHLGIVRHRFGWFLLTFVVGCGLYGLAYLSAQATYEAKATLLIQIESPEPFGGSYLLPIRQPAISLVTKEQLLRSEEVFEAACLIREASKVAGRRITTLAEAKVILTDANNPLVVSRAALRAAVHHMMTAVKVVRRDDQGQIVEIIGTANDPQTAIEMVNAHAIACQDQSEREVRASYKAALAEIEETLRNNIQRQSELQEHLDKIFEYDADPGSRRADIEEEIRRKRAEKRAAKNAISRIDREIQRILAEIHRFGAGMPNDTGMKGLSDAEISPLAGRITELEAQLVATESLYGAEHSDVVKLKAELDYYKKKLPAQRAIAVAARIDNLVRERREKEAIVVELDHDIDAQVQEMAQISHRYAQYTPLKREIDALVQDTKDLTGLKRRCEMLISSAQPYVEVHREAIEATPTGRRTPTSALLWLLSAAIVGLMVAYLREYLDTSIVTASNVRKHLNLPLIAIVPYLTRERLVVSEGAPGDLKETYNAAATIIRATLLESGFNTVGVCSANPQEGKTTISINLAVAFARKGLRTLLIDANMRHPKIHELLRIDNSRGLSTLLADRTRAAGISPAPSAGKEEEKVPLSQFVQPCAIEGLFIIPSGPLPSNPTPLLESPRFEELIAEAKKTMDLVIVDSPPVRTFSDALTLSTRVEANIFVVGAGLSRQYEAQGAKHLLANVHARVMGVILNMARRRTRAEYYYYYTEEQKKVRERK